KNQHIKYVDQNLYANSFRVEQESYNSCMSAFQTTSTEDVIMKEKPNNRIVDERGTKHCPSPSIKEMITLSDSPISSTISPCKLVSEEGNDIDTACRTVNNRATTLSKSSEKIVIPTIQEIVTNLEGCETPMDDLYRKLCNEPLTAQVIHNILLDPD
ncbi:unnamed protein product, partial [Meganyctiphanes norvegica]